jgi:hypothetical protein
MLSLALPTAVLISRSKSFSRVLIVSASMSGASVRVRLAGGGRSEEATAVAESTGAGLLVMPACVHSEGDGSEGGPRGAEFLAEAARVRLSGGRRPGVETAVGVSTGAVFFDSVGNVALHEGKVKWSRVV